MILSGGARQNHCKRHAGENADGMAKSSEHIRSWRSVVSEVLHNICF